MDDHAFRVKASWGGGSVSYFYFATEDEARALCPNKTKYHFITGEPRVLHPRRVTIERRGPRGGYTSIKKEQNLCTYTS